MVTLSAEVIRNSGTHFASSAIQPNCEISRVQKRLNTLGIGFSSGKEINLLSSLLLLNISVAIIICDCSLINCLLISWPKNAVAVFAVALSKFKKSVAEFPFVLQRSKNSVLK